MLQSGAGATSFGHLTRLGSTRARLVWRQRQADLSWSRSNSLERSSGSEVIKNRWQTKISLVVPLLISVACVSPAPLRGVAITNVTVIDALHGQRDEQTVVFDSQERRARETAVTTRACVAGYSRPVR